MAGIADRGGERLMAYPSDVILLVLSAFEPVTSSGRIRIRVLDYACPGTSGCDVLDTWSSPMG